MSRGGVVLLRLVKLFWLRLINCTFHKLPRRSRLHAYLRILLIRLEAPTAERSSTTLRPRRQTAPLPSFWPPSFLADLRRRYRLTFRADFSNSLINEE